MKNPSDWKNGQIHRARSIEGGDLLQKELTSSSPTMWARRYQPTTQWIDSCSRLTHIPKSLRCRLTLHTPYMSAFALKDRAIRCAIFARFVISKAIRKGVLRLRRALLWLMLNPEAACTLVVVVVERSAHKIQSSMPKDTLVPVPRRVAELRGRPIQNSIWQCTGDLWQGYGIPNKGRAHDIRSWLGATLLGSR